MYQIGGTSLPCAQAAGNPGEAAQAGGGCRVGAWRQWCAWGAEVKGEGNCRAGSMPGGQDRDQMGKMGNH